MDNEDVPKVMWKNKLIGLLVTSLMDNIQHSLGKNTEKDNTKTQ